MNQKPHKTGPHDTGMETAPADDSLILTDRFLLDSLLINSEDIIYFKDSQSRFLRVSRAFAQHAGIGEPAKLLGLTDHDIFKEEHAAQAALDEQSILRTGKPIIGKIEKETWPDGRITWVSTTKLPLKDPEGRIIGTFGISRDVTQQHIAEINLKKLADKLKKQNRMYEDDLELASELFSVFAGHLPPVIPDTPGRAARLRCASAYQPASSKLGGDFFLVIPGPERVRLLVCDVMGHGVQSALVAVLMRTWAQQLASEHATPADWLLHLNRLLTRLFHQSDECFTATAFACDIDYESGRFTHACAGHPPPLIRRESDRAVIRLFHEETHGPGLGLLDEAAFLNANGRLDPGDILLIYTDGLIEARNSEGQDFDITGVEGSLIKTFGAPPSAALGSIEEDLRLHQRQQPQEDDLCILLIERI